MTPEQIIYIADRTVRMPDVLDLNGIYYQGVPSQISCPVHKSGQEIRRSARIYEDNFIWCFTCAKQFTPTEIHAAVKGITRAAAAAQLLEKYPSSEINIGNLLKEYYSPRRKPVPVALLNRANQSLLEFRHRVPLAPYRLWASRLEQLKAILTETELELQPGKYQAFVNQMRNELGSLVRV